MTSSYISEHLTQHAFIPPLAGSKSLKRPQGLQDRLLAVVLRCIRSLSTWFARLASNLFNNHTPDAPSQERFQQLKRRLVVLAFCPQIGLLKEIESLWRGIDPKIAQYNTAISWLAPRFQVFRIAEDAHSCYRAVLLSLLLSFRRDSTGFGNRLKGLISSRMNELAALLNNRVIIDRSLGSLDPQLIDGGLLENLKYNVDEMRHAAQTAPDDSALLQWVNDPQRHDTFNPDRPWSLIRNWRRFCSLYGVAYLLSAEPINFQGVTCRRLQKGDFGLVAKTPRDYVGQMDRVDSAKPTYHAGIPGLISLNSLSRNPIAIFDLQTWCELNNRGVNRLQALDQATEIYLSGDQLSSDHQFERPKIGQRIWLLRTGEHFDLMLPRAQLFGELNQASPSDNLGDNLCN